MKTRILGPVALTVGAGADPGFLKRGGGGHFMSTSKKWGSRRGSNFGPNVKKPTSWAKKMGGPVPLVPHGSAYGPRTSPKFVQIIPDKWC